MTYKLSIPLLLILSCIFALSLLQATNAASISQRHLLKQSEDLIVAAKEGDYETALKLLQSKNKLSPEDKARALYYAAESGQLLVIQLLVQQKTDVNKYEKDYLPIHIATANDHIDVVRYLLMNGAKVDATVKGSPATSLIIATTLQTEQSANIAKVLVINGADISAKDTNGLNALDIAIRDSKADIVDIILDYVKGKEVVTETLIRTTANGTLELMEVLLKQGADINGVDEAGLTPLHMAAATNDVDKVKLLLKNKANVNALDNAGETPLLYASGERCNAAITAELVSKSDVNVEDKNGFTALEKNSMYPGCKEASKILVKAGAEQDLYTAISIGDLNLFKKELTYGEYTYESLREGASGLESPLILASYLGEVEIVEYLLSISANVNVVDGKAVIMAIEEKNFKIVEMLVNAGATPPATVFGLFMKKEPICEGADLIKYLMNLANDVDLREPLVAAIENNCVDILKILLDGGVNPNSVDNNNKRVVSLAADFYNGEISGKQEILKILVKAGAEIDIYIATLLNDKKAVAGLLKNGANPDKSPVAEVTNGQTALWTAANLGYTDIVELLIKAKADLETTDKVFKTTPLIGAIENGHTDVAIMLIKAGANINAIQPPSSEDDSEENTALILAIREGAEKVSQELIAEGAKVDGKNGAGETPLIIASKSGDTSLVCQLLSKGADSTITDAEGNSPIYLAATEGHISIIEVLLAEVTGQKNWESYCAN